MSFMMPKAPALPPPPPKPPDISATLAGNAMKQRAAATGAFGGSYLGRQATLSPTVGNKSLTGQ